MWQIDVTYCPAFMFALYLKMSKDIPINTNLGCRWWHIPRRKIRYLYSYIVAGLLDPFG